MRAAAVLLVASLALPAAALGSDRFTDPRGDAGGDGPDVTAVTVSHTPAAVSIAVDFAAAPPLSHDEREQYTDMLLIGIHTDDDLSRSDVEFWTGVHGVDLERGMVVRGPGPESREVGSADVTVEAATVTLEIARAMLGDPEEIAVEVAAGREYVDEPAARGGEGDIAPSSGPHRYAFTDGSGWPWGWALVAAALVAGVGALWAVGSRRAIRRRIGVAH